MKKLILFIAWAIFFPFVANAADAQKPSLGGKYTGVVPEEIRLANSLAGYKEGNAAPADTLYMFVDSRCPVSRAAYVNSRAWVKNGKTIKWIPVVALGNDASGYALQSTILSKNKEKIDQLMAQNMSIKTNPSKQNRKDLESNYSLHQRLYRQTNRSGVPMALYISQRSNKLQWAPISDKKEFTNIFGKI